MASVEIFCCYAHEDELLLNKLKTHLSPLKRQGFIDVWYDRDISAGMKWEKEIDKHLNEANIILLLISPDFMDSDYCYGVEMQQALERDERGEARVIPIILRPVYWQDVLGNLQALPTDAKPVMSSSWQYQDEALLNVTEGIRKVVINLAINRDNGVLVNNERRLPASNIGSTLKNEMTQVNTMKDDILRVVHNFETQGQPPTFRNITQYLKRRETWRLRTAIDDMVLEGLLFKNKSGKALRYTTIKKT